MLFLVHPRKAVLLLSKKLLWLYGAKTVYTSA